MSAAEVLAPTSDALALLAAEANSAHADTEVRIGSLREVFRDAAKHAMRAGDALIEAKALIPHGGWIRWAKKKRQDRAARAHQAKLLAQAERDKAVKKAAGATSKAYSLIRQAVSEVDRLTGQTEDAETKRLLGSALRHLHHAEDDVVATLRLERTR